MLGSADDFDDDGDELLLSIPCESVAEQRSASPVFTTQARGDSSTSERSKSNLCQELSRPQIKETLLQSTKEEIEEVHLPEFFPFPFTPYDIQVGFMKDLYTSLELGKIGIFESPTGTGKSLSLICGALKWLKDLQERKKRELEAILEEKARCEVTKETKEKNTQEFDWITEFAEKENLKKYKEEQDLLLKKEAKLQKIKNNFKPSMGKRKRTNRDSEFDDLMKGASADVQKAYKEELDANQTEPTDDSDDHIVVADYHSDEESQKEADSSDDEDSEEDHVTKIYYCSRTHSQLSQFVKEVQKSPFGVDTSVVSLGSRQNLCINESVKRLKSLSLMNDRCIELQKNKKSTRSADPGPAKRKKVCGCPFYKQDQMKAYRDRVLVEVKDIEQLVTMGKESKACPYYGTRYAVPSAEIVALPYNTLLHKTTREACGIRLQGNVVIIDEAHNLLETINSVYSVEITGGQIFCAHSQVSQYVSRYRSRLKAKNLLYINQILFILSKFVKCLGGNLAVPSEQQKITNTATRLWTINDFLFHSQMDNMNLFKVKRYCERSQIAKKLHGFVEKYQPSLIPTESEKTEKDSTRTGLSTFLQEISQKKMPVETSLDQESPAPRPEPDSPVVRSSPLMLIEGFLAALTNADKDGRVVIQNQDLLSRSSIKFLLLNPAVHFAEVVNEARAVIVTGGTMQPISEFKSQLFHAAGVAPERILEYSCGHVIPGDHLLPMTVAQGPSGVDLDFTYQSRDRPELLDELGRLLCNVCSAVPCGIVIFFPSYDYEKKVYEHWQKTGMLQRIATKKKVFREPKRAGQVDQILNEYADFIQKCSNTKDRVNCSLTGAILLCVVGGKMSEGINFSDDLGRCIIMVGLPYPNIRSPELKEKMDYLNSNFPKSPDGRLPGQVHYENLCMKAVNQSIGRAIRHREDYAAILMLDRRYGKNSVSSKLPAWIAKHLQKTDKFGSVYSAVIKFFNDKKKLQI